MFASFFRPFTFLISTILLICILFCMFIPAIYKDYNFYSSGHSSEFYYLNLSDGSFPWPTPGYTYVTSPFGYRYAPTSGASTYHSGIDIGAPTGTNIVAICSGEVTYLGFNRCWWIYNHN